MAWFVLFMIEIRMPGEYGWKKTKTIWCCRLGKARKMLYLTERDMKTNAHALHVHDEWARLCSRIGGGPAALRRTWTKPTLIAVLIAVITFLHYYTTLSAHHLHLFYQNLYFLPVILAGFWFGLRGGLITSLSITVLYLPFCLMNWEDFSPNDANALMEMVLYLSLIHI